MSACVVPNPSAPRTSDIDAIEEPLPVCGGAYGNREARSGRYCLESAAPDAVSLSATASRIA